MERCEKYVEWISAYVDGELDADEQAELRRHLEVCPACKRTLMAYRTMSFNLLHTEVSPPADFAADVMARVTSLSSVRTMGVRRSRRPHLRRILAAAAMFAVVAAIGFASIRGGFEGETYEAAMPLATQEAADAPIEEFFGDSALHFSFARDSSEGPNMLWGGVEPIVEPGASDNPPVPDVPDMTLLDLAVTGAQWEWSDLVQVLEGSGFVYDLTYEGAFEVEDPHNPGSYLYGILADGEEERIVELIGYRFRHEDVDRRVEIRTDGEAATYYTVRQISRARTRAQNLRELRHYILFGE